MNWLPAARRFSWCLLFAMGAMAMMPGCGNSGPRVLKVTGTATRAGKPVSRLVVNFWPEHGRPSWGLTDAEGHYELKYDKDRDGAVAGKHNIWVQAKPSSPKEEVEMAQGLIARNPELGKILEKYGDQKTSPLNAEVKDQNQVIDLPLD